MATKVNQGLQPVWQFPHYSILHLNFIYAIILHLRLVAVDLPPEAKTPSTRFRWWQPSHSGKGYDQWAVDDIVLGKYANLRSLEDDFDVC